MTAAITPPTERTWGTIEHHPGTWVIRPEPDAAIYFNRVITKLKLQSDGSLTVSDAEGVAADIDMLLHRFPMQMSPTTRLHLSRKMAAHRQRIQDVHDILTSAVSASSMALTPAIEPRPYQIVAHNLATTTGSLLLADDMGLGKTFSSLLALSDPTYRPMLVVTLTGLPRQWIRELNKYFPGLTSHEIQTTAPYPLADHTGQYPDMVVMNYAKLRHWAHHVRGRFRAVVFDEAQELRNSDSQKYDAAAAVAHGADLVMGLSGTPVYNWGGEMFNVCDVLRPGSLGTRPEFLREWTSGSNDPRKVRIKDPEAFRAFLLNEGLMLRRTRSDVGIEMPSAVLVDQYVETDERAYRDAAGNAAEMARLILAQSSTPHQKFVSSGTLDATLRQATGIAKAPFVADFVRLLLEQQERVILYGWHRAVYDVWLEKLADLRPVLYTGSETTNRKAETYQAFTEGDARVMIMSLRSGAGLDGLQNVCNTVVFGEMDWSPGVHKQCITRLHRPGVQDTVYAYFCTSPQGSDPVMLDVLGLKAMEADLIVAPDQAKVVDSSTGGDHIKRLAEAVLAHQ